MAEEETPVVDALADITAVSLERSTLVPRELMLARIAALVSVDAPPASYLLNAGTVVDVGVTADDVQGTVIAVAPIVGTPRIVAAGSKPRHCARLCHRSGRSRARSRA